MTTALHPLRIADPGAEHHAPADRARAAPPAPTTSVGRTQGSANASVFIPSSADVIEAWARQAAFASGFGGGLGEDLHARRSRVQVQAAQASARHAPDLAHVALRHLAARIAAWWREQRAVARARATARELAELDDHQLHDIGLSRSEILSAALESERRIANPGMRVHAQRLA